MTFDRLWRTGWKVPLVAALLVGMAACDGSLLDVEDPDNVEPEAELTPSSVQSRFAGMLNTFREAYDDYVLYTGLHTDEFILAGTFPTRIEVDARRPTTNNGSINGDVWQPLSVARATADDVVADFQAASGSPDFASVQGRLEQGIAWGRLFGGYTRIFLAEFFCHSILGGQGDLPSVTGQEPESAPKTTVQRLEEAVALLASAESFAESTGQDEIADAARVGQARAHLYLGTVTADAQHFTDAADKAAEVGTPFNFTLPFSFNTPGEENEVFQSTWGVNANERWTVGIGQDASRFDEAYAYFTEWETQGLLIPPAVAQADPPAGPGLSAFNGRSPIEAQTLYAGRAGNRGRAASMVLASGWEARMVEAEVDLRNGNPGTAETTVNNLLDSDQSQNPIVEIQPGINGPAPAGAFTTEILDEFSTVSFDGAGDGLEDDLLQLARARQAGLWLTGERQGTLRRLAQDPTLNFDRTVGGLWNDVQTFEGRSRANSISLPVPSDEVDNNENIGSACPASGVNGGTLP